MEIIIKHDENEPISSLAYGLGKALEKVIDTNSEGLIDENKYLKAKILDFVPKLKGQTLEQYKKHFKIETTVNGT